MSEPSKSPVERAVLDASIVVDWLAPGQGRSTPLRRSYERGSLRVVAPSLLHLELLNVTARRWRWRPDELEQLALRLDAAGFQIVDPRVFDVARWASRGITAYDACYVALAEAQGVPLFTRDREIVSLAPGIARLPETESDE
jgi:predicted nucleic acid-binding protein